MEDIKVGEYVRTKEGDITRIKYFLEDKDIYSIVGENDLLYGNPGKVVKKHSKNLIDLIEIGDYVNGYFVYKVTNTCIYVRGKAIERKDTLNIKSIVTKEQFTNIEYKLNNN